MLLELHHGIYLWMNGFDILILDLIDGLEDVCYRRLDGGNENTIGKRKVGSSQH